MRAAAVLSSSDVAVVVVVDVEDSVGRESVMEKSFMIWSAVRRRSEERSGARGLICSWWG